MKIAESKFMDDKQASFPNILVLVLFDTIHKPVVVEMRILSPLQLCMSKGLEKDRLKQERMEKESRA